MSISFLHLPHIVVVAFLCVDHKMMKKEKLFVKVLAKCPLFNFAVECLEYRHFQKCCHNAGGSLLKWKQKKHAIVYSLYEIIIFLLM